jgi:uncharacterized protein YkwD
MIRRIRRPLARVVLASALFSTFAFNAPAPASAEVELASTRMVRLVNQLRVARGLNMLEVDPVLQQTSDRWSNVMAVSGSIFHNNNLRDEIQSNWSKVGENVGRGPSVDDIQVGFSTSPDHLENLLDPRWDVMAIGVVASRDGLLYVTQHFEDLREPKPGSAAPAPRSSQRPTRRVRPIQR